LIDLWARKEIFKILEVTRKEDFRNSFMHLFIEISCWELV